MGRRNDGDGGGWELSTLLGKLQNNFILFLFWFPELCIYLIPLIHYLLKKIGCLNFNFPK